MPQGTGGNQPAPGRSISIWGRGLRVPGSDGPREDEAEWLRLMAAWRSAWSWARVISRFMSGGATRLM